MAKDVKNDKSQNNKSDAHTIRDAQYESFKRPIFNYTVMQATSKPPKTNVVKKGNEDK